jgi:hypothetical protein
MLSSFFNRTRLHSGNGIVTMTTRPRFWISVRYLQRRAETEESG